jgi:hypothetical protein
LALVLLHASHAAINHIDPDIEYTSVHGDGGAETDPHQVVRAGPSFELADDADEQIVQCLEHVRRNNFSLVIFESNVMTLLLRVVQALDLSKPCMHRNAV